MRPFGSGFEWSVAMRYLKARRTDGFISVIAGFSLIGIMLGVAILIIVMSVMNGFRAELVNKLLGFNGHAIMQGYDGQIADYQALADRLAGVEGVTRAIPYIHNQVLAIGRENNASGAFVRGLPDSELDFNKFSEMKVISGELEGLDYERTIVMGHRLAERLGLRAGDEVTLIAPQATSTPMGALPRGVSFMIAATLEVGVYDFDNLFVGMPLSEAQTFFRYDDTVSNIEIFVEEPSRIESYLVPLQSVVGERGFFTTWRRMNQSLVSALDVERNVMFLILVLIILVAAFNIISSLIMLVKDKAREVAILRTMGATQGAILRIFVIAGASIGVIGTVAGLMLGLLIAENIGAIQSGLSALLGTELWNPEIRWLSEMPADVDIGEVLATAFVALLLSFLATLPPSWRAARLDPVEVLRYE